MPSPSCRAVLCFALALLFAAGDAAAPKQRSDEPFLRVSQRVPLGSNLGVEFRFPKKPRKTDWLGIFKEDLICQSCWLTWRSAPSEREGTIQFYDTRIVEAGLYEMRYCHLTQAATACELISNVFEVYEVPGGKRRPVLLMPGVAGSILEAKNTDKPDDLTSVWVRINFWGMPSANTLYKRHVRCLFNPATDLCEQTTPGEVVRARDSMYGLDGIAMLGAEVNMERTVLSEGLYYFHDLIDMLMMNGWMPGMTLRGFPYDFRQAIDEPSMLKRLHETITELHDLNRRPVDIVSHSMGGLVFQSYLLRYPEARAMIGKVIAVGTPWRGGSAATVQAFVYGHVFGNLALSEEAARLSAPSFLSAYSLLPSNQFEFKPDPVSYHRCSDLITPITVPREELAEFLGHVTKDQMVEFAGRSDKIKHPFNPLLYTRAQNLEADLVAMSGALELYNIVGRGKPTSKQLMFTECLKDDEELSRLRLLHFTNLNVDGDSSVTFESANAPFTKPRETLVVEDDHQALIKHHSVMTFVLERLVHRGPANDANKMADAPEPNRGWSLLPVVGGLLAVGAVGVAGVVAWRYQSQVSGQETGDGAGQEYHQVA